MYIRIGICELMLRSRAGKRPSNEFGRALTFHDVNPPRKRNNFLRHSVSVHMWRYFSLLSASVVTRLQLNKFQVQGTVKPG